MSGLAEIGSCTLPRAATVDQYDSGSFPPVLPGAAGPPGDGLEAGGCGYRADRAGVTWRNLAASVVVTVSDIMPSDLPASCAQTNTFT